MPYYVEDEDEQGRKRYKAVPTKREKAASWIIVGVCVALFIALLWMTWPTFRF